jgi:hypothetical protein
MSLTLITNTTEPPFQTTNQDLKLFPDTNLSLILLQPSVNLVWILINTCNFTPQCVTARTPSFIRALELLLTMALRNGTCLLLFLLSSVCVESRPAPPGCTLPPLLAATQSELQNGLQLGCFSSVELVMVRRLSLWLVSGC